MENGLFLNDRHPTTRFCTPSGSRRLPPLNVAFPVCKLWPFQRIWNPSAVIRYRTGRRSPPTCRCSTQEPERGCEPAGGAAGGRRGRSNGDVDRAHGLTLSLVSSGRKSACRCGQWKGRFRPYFPVQQRRANACPCGRSLTSALRKRDWPVPACSIAVWPDQP